MSVPHKVIRLVDERRCKSETERREMMRFMMLMIPQGYEAAAPGTVPPA
jgi:hypothetical protein